MPIHAAPAPRGAAARALLAVCLAALALPLSFSAGALAVPAIARTLGGSASALNWVTNAFMLAFGGLLLTAGALADRHGRRRLFLGGAGGFALASLGVSLAPSVVLLDVLRAAQGAAAAAALAGGSASLAQLFEGHARTRAFSFLGTTFGIGLALGPLLAGNLIAWLGWRAVFASGVLLGTAAWWLALRALPETHGPRHGRMDWAGSATFTAAIALLTVGLMQAGQAGWMAAPTVTSLAASVAAFFLFVRTERRAEAPLLDLSLFRYGRFVGVQVLPLATCYGYVVLLVLMPLHLVGTQGMPEAHAALLMLALTAPMMVVPVIAGYLARHWESGTLCAAGLLVAAAGLAWLATVIDGPTAALVAPMLCIGMGTGLPWGLMDDLSVSVVPVERAGMAAGIFGTTRVAGEGIALALVTSLLSAFTARYLPGTPDEAMHVASMVSAGNLPAAAAVVPATTLQFAHGTALHQLLWLLAAITFAAALLVAVMLRRPAALREATA